MSDSSPTRPRPFQLGKLGRRAIWGAFCGLWLSGVLWWWLHRFARTEGEFGGSAYPAEAWMLRLHGAASMVSLLVIGALLPTHIARAWNARVNRVSGILFIALIGALIVTAYGLYYVGNESWRSWMSWTHSIGGAVLPGLMIWHIWEGRRSTARRSKTND